MKHDEWDHWEREDDLAAARGCLSVLIGLLMLWAVGYLVLTQSGIIF